MALQVESGQYVIERVEAQRTSTLIQVAALAGAAVCMVLAAWLQAPINAQRKELQLVMQSDLYKELPPEYAWVSAFGAAFRGVAVDVLWIRAESLKEEGKYYESHQLAKWICTLQPRFPQVWSFQAWNMSYNISVATHTPQERWQWVYNGIRLLRDEGIPNNERVVPLYHQLAWTWFHKVGDQMDDCHNFYKRAWAAAMETLLGPPPVGLSNAETIDWFRPVVAAPRKLEDLIAARPGVARLVEQLAGLGIDVQAETNAQRLFHPLEEQFFKPYTGYVNERRLAALRSKPRALDERERQMDQSFANATKEDFDALLAWMRAKVLREQYKMDPQFMLDLTGELGTEEPIPIDWRTPWSQSIYWAKYGVEQGLKAKNLKDFDHLNTDRILLFSLSSLAKEGRYSFRINLEEPMKSWLSRGPDFRYIEAMHRKYIALGTVHADPGEDVENRTTEWLRSGHVNNLESGIVALYLGGREAEAQRYLEYLLEYYPDPFTKKRQERYMKSVADFVWSQLAELAEVKSEAQRMIYALLSRGYVALASGLSDEYEAAVRNAWTLYKQYQEGAADSSRGRQKMIEFPDLRGDALALFVTEPGYPLSVRSTAWMAEQEEVKRQCYDDVVGYLRAECEHGGFDAARAFPEPPGMAAWRKEHPAPVQPEDEYQKKLNIDDLGK